MIDRFGLPEMVVFDNDTAFTSDKFKQFVVGMVSLGKLQLLTITVLQRKRCE